jgi:hypothetical protein
MITNVSAIDHRTALVVKEGKLYYVKGLNEHNQDWREIDPPAEDADEKKPAVQTQATPPESEVPPAPSPRASKKKSAAKKKDDDVAE